MTSNSDSAFHQGEDTGPPVDASEALRSTGGDRELLLELVALFLDEYPKRLEELRDAMSRGDKTQLQRVAHGLKGTLMGFGAARAQRLAAQLELDAKTGALAQAPHSLARLERELARVAESLSAGNWPSGQG